jgi:hypothetical protein
VHKDLEKLSSRRVISGRPTLCRNEKRIKQFGLKISVVAAACKIWTVVEGC